MKIGTEKLRDEVAVKPSDWDHRLAAKTHMSSRGEMKMSLNEMI